MSDQAVRNAFQVQAQACEKLGSPLTARLCRVLGERLDTRTEVGRTVLSWTGDVGPSGQSVPLRMAGTLHALIRTNRIAPLSTIDADDEDGLWEACRDAFTLHSAFILERLKSPPQTNEVRRSAALLPGFLTIARLTGKPLVLSEVGASAGLNLQFDRYRYQLGNLEWGGKSTVLLTTEWRGAEPPEAMDIEISDRAGCDLNPLEPSSAQDRLKLMSYIWPDQPDRLDRAENALEIAAKNGLHVDKADAIDWLTKRLETPRTHATHVVYHSVAWQYFPEELKITGERLLADAGQRATQDAPLARLQMEADDSQKAGAALTLQIWPSGKKREIGRADFHGRWVEWQGW